MNRRTSAIFLVIAGIASLGSFIAFRTDRKVDVLGQHELSSMPAARGSQNGLPPESSRQAPASPALLQRAEPAAHDSTPGLLASIPSEQQGAIQDEDGDLPPGSKVEKAKIVKLHGEQPLTVDHPHVKPAIEVQERNSKWLMALPAVTGTAIGLNDDGEIALVVYTKAETADIPKVIDGLPVVTWKTGLISSRRGLAKEVAKPELKTAGGRPHSKPVYQTEIRPLVPIGVSTSLTGSLTPGYWTAGTLGCRVKNLTTGATFALSNYHVYTFNGTVTIGGVVLQPGTLDSQGSITDGSDFLGNVAAVAAPDFTPGTVNQVDAAIATTSILGVATFDGGYGTPSSTTSSAALNATVEKCGRTTGDTLGVISQISVMITVQYDEGLATFENQIGIVKPTRRSPSFSDSGDSGSLIVVYGSNSPVGLLFAGSTNSTFANPIAPVLKKFNVKVDDGN